MDTVIITGGTGMIGNRLCEMLVEKNYEVIVLTRDPSKYTNAGNIKYAEWDIDKGTINSEAFQKAKYLIHLAGAGIAEKRWTKKRKKEILESRSHSADLIVSALQNIQHNIEAVISASAIGWYGNDTKNTRQNGFTEQAPPADNFLGNTCKQWEENIEPVRENGIRLVILRTGIVLSNNGGALAEYKKPIQKGIAAILGSGTQVISWIHIDDICRMYIFAMENKNLNTVYNAAAPMKITNKELNLELAKKIKGKRFIPLYVPGFLLHWVLGELSIEVLKSTTVNSDKIRKEGFTFIYPSLEGALNNLLNSK